MSWVFVNVGCLGRCGEEIREGENEGAEFLPRELRDVDDSTESSRSMVWMKVRRK